VNRFVTALLFVAIALGPMSGPGCASKAPSNIDPIAFWHTFNEDESAVLQAWLDDAHPNEVVTTILPFARATTRFRSAVREGTCPDLLRIDSSRIPALVAGKMVLPVPDSIWKQRAWLSESRDLVAYTGKVYGLPQTLDGLALIRKRGFVSPWPFESLLELEQFLDTNRATQSDRSARLGILIDGYWFLAFLRTEGSDLPDIAGSPSIRDPRAVRALNRLAHMFQQGWTLNILDERDPSRAIIRAFRQDKIRIVMTGSWHLSALANGNLDTLEVSAFPEQKAPRGGQVLVVPTCSAHAERAWNLAVELTAPSLQADWAKRLGFVPVTRDGLLQAGRVANEFYRAIKGASLVPRHEHAPELFDDLTPAVLAVIGGDASAQEALDGVARAWSRILLLSDEETNAPQP